jgi:D-alanyl-D-alanine carboxypeptidase
MDVSVRRIAGIRPRRGHVLRARILICLSVFLLAACQSGGAGTSNASFNIPTLAHAEARAVGDPRYAGIVIDAESGKVLYAEDADQRRRPASLAKMMTLYLTFEAIESGRLSRREMLTVSRHAARQPPSKLGLRAGSRIRVDDAIKAIAVRSANDIAVVMAEAIAGSESAFAQRMTAKARALGLTSTVFTNASGLPDSRMVTTARDMALLARTLQTRFPRESRVFATKSFSYKGRRYTSTNRLLGVVNGMDGMKTGYTRASGYNLAASVRRRGRHLIIVVMGEKSGSARNGHVAALVEEYLPSGFLARF